MTHQPSHDQDLRTALTPYEVLKELVMLQARELRRLDPDGEVPADVDDAVARLKAALTPAQAPDKAGEREGVDEIRQAFDAAAEARDEAGFVGTPADCIRFFAAEVDRLQALTPKPTGTEMVGRPIDEAPRDGTPIIAWGAPSISDPDVYEWRQTRWTLYGEGSIAHARFKAGQGPEGYWDWSEPMHNWGSSWEPTRFIDLPALARQPNGTEASRGVGADGPVERAVWAASRFLEHLERVAYRDGTGLRLAPAHVRFDSLQEYLAEAKAALTATPTAPLSPDSTGPAGDDDEQTTERAMMRIEAEADAWISETPDIGKMVKIIAHGWPSHLKDRAAAQTDALVRQTFVEAFYRGFNAHRDHAAAVAALTPSAPIAAPVRDDGAREALQKFMAAFEGNGTELTGEQEEAYSEAAAYLDKLAEDRQPETDALSWAVERWRAEVQNRPLRNVHRRSLDTTWRQVIRRFGGLPDALVGPSHDDLVASLPLPAGDVPGEAQIQEGGR